MTFVVRVLVKHVIGGGWVDLANDRGQSLVLDYHDLIESDEAWNTLEAGQTIAVEHRIEYWKIFGKMIVKKHTDKLVPANLSQ